MNFKIVVFGAKDTTVTVIDYLQHDLKLSVGLLVTVDDNVTRSNEISGFSPMQEVAEKYGIDVFYADSYSLNSAKCQCFFKENSFDLGISMGWQRLVPRYVLDSFKTGVFGFHGSCGYLPFGRGRSVLNWSLIQGLKRFNMNLFKYDEYADSPNVFMKTMFEITDYDTIRTLQYKYLIASKKMLASLFEAYSRNAICINTESKDFDSWYPKRSAEDGHVDFAMSTMAIYNLIRAVTHPFPGAYCYCSEKKVMIWDAVPFDCILDFSGYRPGEIIDVMDNNLVVRTIDGSLLIRGYESPIDLTRGSVLSGVLCKE
ncbi:hypothetical protein LJC46_01970 [Desulfovibrio sp. OttesenSCG-928-G15]|nr:hypothetical protein [Desulfovibrio sp. OttesenSCG-928-G15]